MNSQWLARIRQAVGWPIVAFGFVFVVIGLVIWNGWREVRAMADDDGA